MSRPHETHFDDCGCLSARHAQQIADANAAIKRLQVALAAREAECRDLLALLREANHNFNVWARDEDGIHPEVWPFVERLRAALSRPPGGGEALRAMLTSEAAVEAVAAVEHDQWWQWAVSVLDTEPGLSHDRAARWRSLFVPYAELSQDMKEHDRKWARLALAAIVARLLPEGGSHE